MEKFYSFAGVDIVVSTRPEWMYTDDRALEQFRAASVDDPHHFAFEMVRELTPPRGSAIGITDEQLVYSDEAGTVHFVGALNGQWRTAYMRIHHSGKLHTVELKADRFASGLTAKTALNAANVQKLVLERDGIAFHASCVATESGAIVFTAPSGVGKSTQAELWRSLRGARIVNGDRCVLRIAEGEVLACGIPFSGSSSYCENVALPLKAIVYLGQASQTSIRRLRGTEAFRRIWEGVSVNTWNVEDVASAMDITTRVIGAVPVYHLVCTPDESAVLTLEQQL